MCKLLQYTLLAFNELMPHTIANAFGVVDESSQVSIGRIVLDEQSDRKEQRVQHQH